MWGRGEKGFYAEMMDHVGTLILLNLLWCLCCLPVVTAGAATVALQRVCFDMLEEGGKGSVRNFWRYFRELFVRSTIIWLFFLFVAVDLALLASQAGIIGLMQIFSSPVLATVTIMLLMIYWFVINWSFPLVAFGGEGGLLKVLGKAFSLAVTFPAKTFLCLGIMVIMILLSILCPLILLGTVSCSAYLVCRVVRPVLRRAMEWELSWE